MSSSASAAYKRSKYTRKPRIPKTLCDAANPNKGTGLKVTTPDGVVHRIRQFSGAVSFYLLRNLDRSLPMLMLFGDRHMTEEQRPLGLCDPEYCDRKNDCIANDTPECCCFSLSNENLYTLLMNAYGTEDHPVDIYTETWRHTDLQDLPSQSIYKGSMIFPAMELSRSMSRKDRRIRRQSADTRGSGIWTAEGFLGSRIHTQYTHVPKPSEYMNQLVDVLLRQDDDEKWTFNTKGIASFVMASLFQDRKELPSILRKEIQKQRLQTREKKPRSLTDPEVWKDLYEMSMTTYFYHIESFKLLPEAVQADREKYSEHPEEHRQVAFGRLPFLKEMLRAVFAVLVDLYFIARLLKRPCLATSREVRANCKTVWPKLVTLFLGKNHIRNIYTLLTDDSSPVSFYDRLIDVDLTNGVEIDMTTGQTSGGDLFRCVNLQEYDLSQNLDHLMKHWSDTFQEPPLQ